MFFHQLGDDFVLALEILMQGGDVPETLILRSGVLAFQRGGTVLEEQFLPLVEQRGLQLVLVAQVGDGDSVDLVAPEDGDFLDRCIVLAGLSHEETPADVS